MASTQTSVRRWVASRTSSSLSPPSASHSLLMPNLLDLPHIPNQKSAVRQCRDARQTDPQILLRDLVLNARAQELRSSFHQFDGNPLPRARSEEHTSELQSLMRNSYAVFCLQTQSSPH